MLNVILVNPDDTEELALTLEGKKKKLTRAHFERFGKDMGLNDKQVEGVFKRFIKHKQTAFNWIDRSWLSEELRDGYKAILEKRYLVIDI